MSLTSTPRAESAQGNGCVGLTDFATINLPLLEAPATSRTSLSLKSNTKAPNISQHAPGWKDRTTATASPERGRSRTKVSPTAGAARKTYAGPISPDRFIPKRDFDLSSTPFRVNKHPQQLSPREKLLRRRLPGDDPFLPAPHHLPPSLPAQKPTPTRVPQRPQQRPRLVTESTVVGGNGTNDFLRQVSSGTVWGVGGTSAVRGDSTVADSSPVLSPGRHTAAPSYAANFLPRTPPADEQSKHESRLALALDIDPTTRLLETCTPSVESSPSPTSSDYERLSPFVWKDSAWKKVEREQCKCC